MIYHAPVLLQTVLDFLSPNPGQLYIDATLGGGGHTFEILKRGAKVLGIDRDPEALEYVKEKISNGDNLTLVQGNFSNIEDIATAHGFGQVSGILFDLGVSSHQLDEASRGFSFKRDGPLDMRMDPSLTVRAKDIINNFPERRLDEIFKTYGQEKLSRPIAASIILARQIEEIRSTSQLAEVIRRVYAKRHVREKIDPATRAFQALRIVVNSELLNLEEALPQTSRLLRFGGRLVVISFHSLEDTTVKRFLKLEKDFEVLTSKPIGPEEEEIRQNPRARSAKLRAAQKV